jgi:hypothetical protein
MTEVNSGYGYLGDLCTVSLDEANNNMWVLRNRSGDGTKGPGLLAANFNLIHEKSECAIFWGAFGSQPIVANYYYTWSDIDGSNDIEAVFIFDRLGSNPDLALRRSPAIAMNNHDKTHVLDVKGSETALGTPVLARTWNSGMNPELAPRVSRGGFRRADVLTFDCPVDRRSLAGSRGASA